MGKLYTFKKSAGSKWEPIYASLQTAYHRRSANELSSTLNVSITSIKNLFAQSKNKLEN